MSDGVLIAFITSGCALVGVLVTVIAPRVIRQGRALDEVRDQVSNSHGTNLRDDLDLIRDEMRAGFHLLTDRLSDVATDLAWERRERMDLAERTEGKRPIA